MSGIDRRTLGVFAKWPRAGTTKTRLAGGDPSWSAAVAWAFLLDTLDRLAGVEAHRVIAFAPPEAEGDFAGIAASRFALEPQAPGDLGQRLSAFFRRQLERTATSVVAVGTDSPTLPVSFVERA